MYNDYPQKKQGKINHIQVICIPNRERISIYSKKKHIIENLKKGFSDILKGEGFRNELSNSSGHPKMLSSETLLLITYDTLTSTSEY